MICKNNITKGGTIIVLLFVISFVYLCIRMRYGLNGYDDGVLFYGAERVLEGNIPYKDFWFVYSPGNLYVLAIIFKIFGPSVFIARIFNAVICFLLVFVTYLLAKKIFFNKTALMILIGLTTLLTGLFGIWANLNLPLLFALLSSIYFIDYLKTKQKHYLIYSGFLIGLTTFFRYDFGLYAFIGLTTTLIAFQYYNSKSRLNWIGGIIQFFKLWFIVLGGILIILFPLSIYFIIKVPFPDIISQFIIFPLKIYPLYRQNPYPIPTSVFIFLIYYFPPLIFLITSIWTLSKIFKGHLVSNGCWPIIFLFFLGLFFMIYALGFSIPSHLYPATFPALILFSFFFSKYATFNQNIRFKEIKKNMLNKRTIFTLFSILIILAYCFVGITNFYSVEKKTIPLDVDRGYGIFLSQFQNDLIDTVNYIQLTVPPDKKIFVGRIRHDKLFSNDEIIYFLTGRQSATKYSDMHPGVVTTHPIQMEIISELKKNNVTYIILQSDNSEKFSGSINQSSGITDLDVFIKNNYRPIKKFGNYTIYELV